MGVERVPRRLDLPGALTVTMSMLLIAYAVVRLEHPGQGWGWTLASFAGGVAALTAFVAVERRSPAPLVRLGILKSGPLVRANVSALLFAGSFFGFQFLVTLYLQELRGWSTLETSLALLAVGIDAILAPTLTPRLVARFGNTRLIFGGLVLAAVAYALFLPLDLDWTYAAMFPSMIILGLGFALAYGPLTIVATDGIAEHEQGLAGGLLYTAFQFGAALGLSAVTAVNVAALGDGSREAALGGFRAALVVPLVMAVLAAIVIASGRQRASAKETRLASEEAIPAS